MELLPSKINDVADQWVDAVAHRYFVLVVLLLVVARIALNSQWNFLNGPWEGPFEVST